jgi:hypothetical protein
MKSERPGPDAFAPERGRAVGACQTRGELQPGRRGRNARADPLRRLRERPRVGQWADDELLSLEEACSLFFPHGPLTVKSLRSAIRLGQLASASIAGRLYTSPSAVRALLKPQLGRSTKPSGTMAGCSGVDLPKQLKVPEDEPPVGRRGRKPKFLKRSR